MKKSVDKYEKLKKSIVSLLKNKGNNEAIDSNLIDELIFNYQLIDKVKADLLNGDYMRNISHDENFPYLQVTTQYTVYNNCLKNILTISTKLSITPQERAKLGLVASSLNSNDGFDD
jgi:hypothetical protein